MKQFIKRTILYVLLLSSLLFCLLAVSSFVVKERHFQNYETESNLLVWNKNEQFDILFMGISHARNFSRHKNHLRLEAILNKTIINIGQGGGKCGINEQLFYLDYFYRKGNTASTVVYVISPPLFFSETLPIASNTFDLEPFELNFFLNYVLFKTENKQQRLSSYLRSKLTFDWLLYQPISTDSIKEKLDSIDTNMVVAAQQMIYKDTLQLHRFYNSTNRVEETIRLALRNDANVILVIPPALFGKWQGHQNVEEFAKQMQKLHGVEYYDFSESVLLPEYYYDHHHLNTNGVVYFTRSFLKRILNSNN